MGNNGEVVGSDLAIFAAAYASGDLQADLDNSGDVDGSDLAIFTADFGRIDCP